jgi:AAA+ ATPase superfamily predicted ATPase
MEKKKPKFYKNTKVNVVKIFRVLKQAHNNQRGFMTVGEIARETGLHKWTVSRTLDVWMPYAVDMVIPEEFEQIGLKVKFVKLAKPDMNEEQVLRGLSVRLNV